MHLSLPFLFASASLHCLLPANAVSNPGSLHRPSAHDADSAARVIQSVLRTQNHFDSSQVHDVIQAPNTHGRDLARSCLTIATFELEKTYEDDTGVSWSCTCGPVLGVGLSSNGVVSCQSHAPYCWISLQDGEEYCANTELDAYFSDNYSLSWLFGTVFADTLYTEVRLSYVSGPRAGKTLEVMLDDYNCVDDDDDSAPCSCEATLDSSKCASCIPCQIQGGKAGDDYDCTNVDPSPSNKVSCRDKDIEQPQKYPMTESIFADTVSTMEPTREPTQKPVTSSPTKQPTHKPVTGSPTFQPTQKPITIADSPTNAPDLSGLSGLNLSGQTPDPTNEPTRKKEDSIYGIAAASTDFTTLADAIDAADLTETLSGDGTFTVFAPTNSAFENLPPDLVTKLFDPTWQPQLKDLLLYHTLGVEIRSTDISILSDGLTTPTLNGEDFIINLNPPRINDDSKILVDEGLVDIEASNGVIHAIDTVLTPSSVTSTIVDKAAGSDSFTTLVAAVTEAGLVGSLSGEGPFTVFAPTDDAFSALPEGTVNFLLQPENEDQLIDILKYHVVEINAVSGSLSNGEVQTLNGDSFRVDVSEEGVSVNEAKVIMPDIIASNGIIHAIDKVLIPPTKQPTNKPTVTPPSASVSTQSPTNSSTPKPTPTPISPSTFTSDPPTSPTKVVDPIVSGPGLFESSLPSQDTFTGPGSIECVDNGVCTFLESLAEECNLIALISISDISSADANNLPSIVASNMNTATSPLSILQGCEITCNDCTFLLAGFPSQMDGGSESNVPDTSTSSGDAPPSPASAESGGNLSVNGVNEPVGAANVRHPSTTIMVSTLLVPIAAFVGWSI